MKREKRYSRYARLFVAGYNITNQLLQVTEKCPECGHMEATSTVMQVCIHCPSKNKAIMIKCSLSYS